MLHQHTKHTILHNHTIQNYCETTIRTENEQIFCIKQIIQ